jgi:hypothetical protein
MLCRSRSSSENTVPETEPNSLIFVSSSQSVFKLKMVKSNSKELRICIIQLRWLKKKEAEEVFWSSKKLRN